MHIEDGIEEKVNELDKAVRRYNPPKKKPTNERTSDVMKKKKEKEKRDNAGKKTYQLKVKVNENSIILKPDKKTDMIIHKDVLQEILKAVKDIDTSVDFSNEIEVQKEHYKKFLEDLSCAFGVGYLYQLKEQDELIRILFHMSCKIKRFRSTKAISAVEGCLIDRLSVLGVDSKQQLYSFGVNCPSTLQNINNFISDNLLPFSKITDITKENNFWKFILRTDSRQSVIDEFL